MKVPTDGQRAGVLITIRGPFEFSLYLQRVSKLPALTQLEEQQAAAATPRQSVSFTDNPTDLHGPPLGDHNIRIEQTNTTASGSVCAGVSPFCANKSDREGLRCALIVDTSFCLPRFKECDSEI